MKTITVKGVGCASVKPDMVVLSMFIKTADKNYELAMEFAAEKINEINEKLHKVGFEKESIKTTDFDVHTEYVSRKDHNGNYHRIFDGYSVSHRLKVSFDFDSKKLSEVLGILACCVCKPEISIDFTVKEPSRVNELLLKSAAENAKKKAEILCLASDVKLGELVNVSYNWGEVNVYSKTLYNMADDCRKECAGAPMSIDIEPDDIEASDTVTFVWQII